MFIVTSWMRRSTLSRLNSILLFSDAAVFCVAISNQPVRICHHLVTTSTTANPSRSRCPALSMATSNNQVSGDYKPWIANDSLQREEAREALQVWPLDEFNAVLLNEVHPRCFVSSTDQPHEIYDLIAIGAGAGGLVSSKQSARRGAKSAMISEHLAGGDCLNVGCVPSKALLSSAKVMRQAQRSSEWGVVLPPGKVQVDFPAVMRRLRRLRAQISPADGHKGTAGTGAHVYQGRGRFTGPDTIEVFDRVPHTTTTLKFRKAVIATGGRPMIPSIPGLPEAPYTTNETLFNLEQLPPRMLILGAGAVALEMAQAFATFGSRVTVVKRTGLLFASKHGDSEAGQLLQSQLEESRVQFVTGQVQKVITLRPRTADPRQFPLLRVIVRDDDNKKETQFECECLLIAAGRLPNVDNLGLEAAGIQFDTSKGILINDFAQTTGNPNVYAIGDCAAGVPRLTHVSGEMAKLAIQNSLFQDSWKVSSLLIPAVMYTEPEYATVGVSSVELANQQGISVDVYRAGLEHNDRAILEGSNLGFCKVFCKAGTDEIVGSTIVAERAGEMINEVSLAIKNNIGLFAVGRNIHAYPTTGEAVMGCGIQFINSHWKRIN